MRTEKADGMRTEKKKKLHSLSVSLWMNTFLWKAGRLPNSIGSIWIVSFQRPSKDLEGLEGRL